MSKSYLRLLVGFVLVFAIFFTLQASAFMYIPIYMGKVTAKDSSNKTIEILVIDGVNNCGTDKIGESLSGVPRNSAAFDGVKINDYVLVSGGGSWIIAKLKSDTERVITALYGDLRFGGSCDPFSDGFSYMGNYTIDYTFTQNCSTNPPTVENPKIIITKPSGDSHTEDLTSNELYTYTGDQHTIEVTFEGGSPGVCPGLVGPQAISNFIINIAPIGNEPDPEITSIMIDSQEIINSVGTYYIERECVENPSFEIHAFAKNVGEMAKRGVMKIKLHWNILKPNSHSKGSLDGNLISENLQQNPIELSYEFLDWGRDKKKWIYWSLIDLEIGRNYRLEVSTEMFDGSVPSKYEKKLALVKKPCCSECDRRNASCAEKKFKTDSVVRLVFQNAFNDYSNCSGFLINDVDPFGGDYFYILTAAHCIGHACGLNDDTEFNCLDGYDRTKCSQLAQVDFYMESDSKEKCNEGWLNGCEQVDNWNFNPAYSYQPSHYEILDCQNKMGSSCENRDWALIKINKPTSVPKSEFSFLEGEQDPVPENTPVFTAHHPLGTLKSISYGSISRDEDLTCQMDLYNHNYIDNGSSGAPIFDVEDNKKVIGILNARSGFQCGTIFNVIFTKYKDIHDRIKGFLGYEIKIENKSFSSGTESNYSAPESAKIGSEVTIESGARVTVTAPIVVINGNSDRRSANGFHAKEGSYFKVKTK